MCTRQLRVLLDLITWNLRDHINTCVTPQFLTQQLRTTPRSVMQAPHFVNLTRHWRIPLVKVASARRRPRLYDGGIASHRVKALTLYSQA